MSWRFSTTGSVMECRKTGDVSPSPGGEGRGEGGRPCYLDNLPLIMLHSNFSMSCQRVMFLRCLEKPGEREGFDYMVGFDKMVQMKG